MLTFQTIGREGQFGNQMFQYATLLGIAQKTGYEYGVPYGNRSEDRYQHFCLPDIFQGLSAKDSAGVIHKYSYFDNDFWKFKAGLFKVPDGTNFRGWFQSEKYFSFCRERILAEFTSAAPYRARAANFLGELRARTKRPIVFVHVRRTDAVDHPAVISLPPAYYYAATSLFKDAHFLLLSDDQAWCRANLHIPGMTYSPFTDKFDDFELMRQCDHGIIAVSSFSWWGAWLGDPSRKIITPASWMRDGRAEDIHCSHWITIPLIYPKSG